MTGALLGYQWKSHSANCSRQTPDPPPVTYRVKPWLERALIDVGPYLLELSEPDKEVLFEAMRNNVHRIGLWETRGSFCSLSMLKAKIQDWRTRGIGVCRN